MGLSHYATRWDYRMEQIREGRQLARLHMLEKGCDWERYWAPLFAEAMRPALLPVEVAGLRAQLLARR